MKKFGPWVVCVLSITAGSYLLTNYNLRETGIVFCICLAIFGASLGFFSYLDERVERF